MRLFADRSTCVEEGTQTAAELDLHASQLFERNRCYPHKVDGAWMSFRFTDTTFETFYGEDCSGYVVCPLYSLCLSLSLPIFALRSEKTRRLSKDATK